jgi:hypothetical protein
MRTGETANGRNGESVATMTVPAGKSSLGADKQLVLASPDPTATRARQTEVIRIKLGIEKIADSQYSGTRQEANEEFFTGANEVNEGVFDPSGVLKNSVRASRAGRPRGDQRCHPFVTFCKKFSGRPSPDSLPYLLLKIRIPRVYWR